MQSCSKAKCKRTATPGFRTCKTCRDIFNRATEKRRRKNEAEGLCHWCRDKVSASNKLCDKCIQLRKDRAKAARTLIKLATLAAYGRVCACCREHRSSMLGIDHINGGGNKHRKQLGLGESGGKRFYLWLKAQGYPEGYQVLCANCNISKHLNGGVCQHITNPS